MKTQNTQNQPAAPVKHTRGPWHIGLKKSIYADRDGTQIAFCDIGTNFDDENLANARLIAAAPELLAALESLLENCRAKAALIATLESREKFDDAGNEIIDQSPEMDTARAAIAKAKGL